MSFSKVNSLALEIRFGCGVECIMKGGFEEATDARC
jgi:hypothetical protein